ncbi:MAG: V-type ATP synthase subunit E [Planctomycetota bacterium]|jgi:V/A-type H+-transporting ATPase subunit E
MDAEQVVEKILSEARAEADKLLAEARQKVSEAVTQQEKELAQYSAQTEDIAAQAAEDKKARMLAAANMKIKKEYLAAKISLFDEVFGKVRQRIKGLSDGEYEQLIIELMTNAVQSGDEEVVVAAGEERINQSMIKQVNRKLGPGYRGNLTLASDKADIDGGFIMRRGRVQVNVSVEVLVAQARDRLELELAEELFGE